MFLVFHGMLIVPGGLQGIWVAMWGKQLTRTMILLLMSHILMSTGRQLNWAYVPVP